MITPNFDLAGLSIGLIQWNIKSNNFFSLLEKMLNKNNSKFKECYGTDNEERFKKYFIEWPADYTKEVWKTDNFCNFIKKKDSKALEEFYLWAKMVHKKDAIETCDKSPKWRTKKGFGSASKSLQPELIDFF